MTVTVRIWPVTVSSDVIGVGVQVEDDSLVVLEVVCNVEEVEVDVELVELFEENVGVTTIVTETESGAAVTVTCAALVEGGVVGVVDDAAAALLAPFVPDGERFN